MEQLGVLSILKILGDFGTLGLVIFLWWSDNKRIEKNMTEHNVQITSILNKYKEDMDAQRKMYESNVSLCRDFASVTKDLRDIVTLNIQTMTECKDAINNNQFCPIIRVSKKKALRLVEEDING